MRRFALFWAILGLFTITTGCITGQVTHAASKWRRARPEVVTATTAPLDGGGSYALTAVESECRVVSSNPEGGEAACYALPRAARLDEDAAHFVDREKLEPVAAYRAGPDGAPKGQPDAAILASGPSRPAIFLRTPSGWARFEVTRFVHRSASGGHPVLATAVEVVAIPFTMVADLATFPIQWFLVPWLPLTPP